MATDRESDGPFEIGDVVEIYSGDNWLASGEIDGEYPPPAADGPNGEWLYDVRSPGGERFDRWSECDLREADYAR